MTDFEKFMAINAAAQTEFLHSICLKVGYREHAAIIGARVLETSKNISSEFLREILNLKEKAPSV